MSSSSASSSTQPRRVKLLCPPVSKTLSFLAWDEQRLDLGSIARTFGLDPSTLKLNGHFISRGVDLVSSSVTWRSLLNFFSAKGLSTGKDDKEALVVDGKLSKAGTKRALDPESDSSKIKYRAELENVGVSSSRRKYQDTGLLMDGKMKESNSSGCDESYGMPTWNGLGFKRKQLIEDHVSSLKKSKINGVNSDFGAKEKKNKDSIVSSGTQVKCSCSMSGNLKRTSESDVILAVRCKRRR